MSKPVEQEDAFVKKLIEDGQAPAWMKDALAKMAPRGSTGAGLLDSGRLISVQPMPGPVGGIAFYRPRYGSKTGRLGSFGEEPCVVDALGALAKRRAKNPFKKAQ